MQDENLQIVRKKKGEKLRDPKNGNILNKSFLDQYRTGTPFILIPIGVVGGKMQYHAEPLISKKFKEDDAGRAMVRGIIGAMKARVFKKLEKSKMATEIKNKYANEINPELVKYYKSKGIDIQSDKGLKQALEQLIYLFQPTNLYQTVGDLIEAKKADGGRDLGFVSIKYNPETKTTTIEAGKTAPISLTVDENGNITTSLNGNLSDNIESFFRVLEESILPNMYFNANYQKLDGGETIFAAIEEDGEVSPFNEPYTTFVKRNTRTSIEGFDAGNGREAYAYQTIVQFNAPTEQTSDTIQAEKKTEVQIPKPETNEEVTDSNRKDLMNDKRVDAIVDAKQKEGESKEDVINRLFGKVIADKQKTDKLVSVLFNSVKNAKFDRSGKSNKNPKC